MLLKSVQLVVVVGKIQDIKDEHVLNAPVKVLAFILLGNTIFFNCAHDENTFVKSYTLLAVPVAGKYTVCRFVQLEKTELKFIDATVGILVNLTHSN
jgi:hypothetical protein